MAIWLASLVPQKRLKSPFFFFFSLSSLLPFAEAPPGTAMPDGMNDMLEPFGDAIDCCELYDADVLICGRDEGIPSPPDMRCCGGAPPADDGTLICDPLGAPELGLACCAACGTEAVEATLLCEGAWKGYRLSKPSCAPGRSGFMMSFFVTFSYRAESGAMELCMLAPPPRSRSESSFRNSTGLIMCDEPCQGLSRYQVRCRSSIGQLPGGTVWLTNEYIPVGSS